MKNKFEGYPVQDPQAEIEAKFIEAQENLLLEFKEKLTLIATRSISSLYCDVSPYATSDAHLNFYNRLRDELSEEILKDLLRTDLSHYSWAASFRRKLLESHKEELQNAIINDLRSELDSERERAEQYRKRLL